MSFASHLQPHHHPMASMSGGHTGQWIEQLQPHHQPHLMPHHHPLTTRHHLLRITRCSRHRHGGCWWAAPDYLEALTKGIPHAMMMYHSNSITITTTVTIIRMIIDRFLIIMLLLTLHHLLHLLSRLEQCVMCPLVVSERHLSSFMLRMMQLHRLMTSNRQIELLLVHQGLSQLLYRQHQHHHRCKWLWGHLCFAWHRM